MDWDLPGSFTEGGADIMEMCSSLPALDGSEDLAGMLPTLHEWSSPRLVKQEKVLKSLAAHPPAPEPESMRACPASPETSPSSPEREEDDAGSTWDAPTRNEWGNIGLAVGDGFAQEPRLSQGGAQGLEGKRLARLAKNKQAAQALRRRKKHYLQQTDSDLHKLKQQNTQLRAKVVSLVAEARGAAAARSALAAENAELRRENAFYEGLVARRKPAAPPPRASAAGRLAQTGAKLCAVLAVVALAGLGAHQPGPAQAVAQPGAAAGYAPQSPRRRLAEAVPDLPRGEYSDAAKAAAAAGASTWSTAAPAPGGRALSLAPRSAATSAAATTEGAGAALTSVGLALPCADDWPCTEAAGGEVAAAAAAAGGDVETLLQLLQMHVLQAEGAAAAALDWAALAELGSAHYGQRSYIFARRAPIELAIAAKAADTDVAVIPLVDPHGEGERGAPRWEYELEPEAAAADGAKAGREAAVVDKRAGAYPAQAQAMAVARAQAVLASLSEVELFFLKRILAYQENGFTSSDFEGMQAEALAWGEAGGAGGGGGLSILLPAPGDGLGLFELDCAVRRARQWSLPAPAGRSGRA